MDEKHTAPAEEIDTLASQLRSSMRSALRAIRECGAQIWAGEPLPDPSPSVRRQQQVATRDASPQRTAPPSPQSAHAPHFAPSASSVGRPNPAGPGDADARAGRPAVADFGWFWSQ
jgi:hypothetical protein